MPKDKTEVKPKDKAELALEKIVFGDIEGFESGLKALDLDHLQSDVEDEEVSSSENDEQDDNIEHVQDDNLFYIDEGDEVEGEDEDGDVDMESNAGESDDQDEQEAQHAVWADSDDEKLQVSLTSTDKLRKLRKTMADDSINGKEYTKRLRARFEKIYPVPKWAKPEDDEGEESDIDLESDEEGSNGPRSDPLADLLRTTSSYVSQSKPKSIPPTQISITRLKDANHSAVSQSAIQTLHFHPSHPLLIASGYDSTLRMYHIDGKSNPIATTLHVRKSPFQTAQFHPDGRRVFAAGRRRYLYLWDIETGDVQKITRMYGHHESQRSMENFKLSPCGRYLALIGSSSRVNILSATNGQWICAAKAEGIVADIAWFSNGNQLMIVNTNGEVWLWNVEQRKTLDRWKDEGGIGTTRIALGNDRWVAIGSNSGIVNIYDLNNMEKSMQMSDAEAITYKPKATLEQLVTTISSLVFSSDCQLLAMASRAKKDAFRLVHIPSFTAYQNWPTSATPLGRVTSVAFTPGNEMLCTANEAGRARLWKLNHYSSE